VSEFADWRDLISIDMINSLHRRGIQKYETGTPTPPSVGCVERSVGGAWNAELYTAPIDSPTYLPGLVFAGHLLLYLAKNHCYLDGNKRVAWSAFAAVLARVGLDLDITDDQAFGFVDSIAKGEIPSVDQILQWVVPRLTERRENIPPV
jgi:death-on-curing protein